MIGNYTLSLIIFMADGIYNLLPHSKMGGMFGRGGMLGEVVCWERGGGREVDSKMVARSCRLKWRG